VAIGIAVAPLVLLGMANLMRHGVRSDLVLATIVPFVLHAVIMLTICSTRVSVEIIPSLSRSTTETARGNGQ
jgi:hypothetical protein